MLVFILSLTAVVSLLYLWRQHDVALEELLEVHRRRVVFEQSCNDRYYRMTLAAIPVMELALSADDEELVEAAEKARDTINKILAEGAQKVQESINELR